jgi:O-antigen ligase
MDFVFLVVAVAAMYLSPPSLWPELEESPIYLILIVTCLALSPLAVFKQLSLKSLIANPITLCVILLIPAIAISLLVSANFSDAHISTWSFAKICIYYLLLVGILNTEARFRQFLFIFLGIVVLVVAIGMIDYYDVVRISAIRQFHQLETDPVTGERSEYLRLRSVNFFHDPSNLGLLVTTGTWITLYGMAERGAWGFRLAGVGLLGFFGWAFRLAGARGAMTALVAGCVAFLLTRFGRNRKKAIALAGVILPFFFLVIGGRATQVNLSGENYRGSRLDLWSRGIPYFVESPIFGIGADQHADVIGRVAHNAVWTAYIELGFLGGTIFLGIFYFAFVGLVRIGSNHVERPETELRRFLPYMMAILASHLIGLLTQPLTYQVPIYTVYGLCAAYCRLTSAQTHLTPIEFNHRELRRLALTSCGFLICFYIFVRAVERFV